MGNAMSFVKIHGAILRSSVWTLPMHVRIVWITMLTLADADGIVEASVGGLANQAQVSREQTEDALAYFLGPDADTRDGTTGERIEKVEGGWLVLNHANYRDRQTRAQRLAALRAQKHRAKAKIDEEEAASRITPVTLGNARHGTSPVISTEAEAEAEEEAEAKAEPRKKKRQSPPRPDTVSEEVWEDWVAHRKAKKATVSATVLRGAEKEAAKAGLSLDEFLAAWVTNGTQGFRADWIKDKGKAAGDPAQPAETFHDKNYGATKRNI